EALRRPESGEARVARCAPAVELGRAAQPAVGARRELRARPFPLGEQPAQVGVMDHAGAAANAALLLPNPGPQETFGSEEAHLRVVGDGSPAAVSRNVVRQTGRTEFFAD